MRNLCKQDRREPRYYWRDNCPRGWPMTLTFAVTLFAIWILVSIPVSLLIVRMMQIEPVGAERHDRITVNPGWEEIA
jgi:uncharacterized membrane protein